MTETEVKKCFDKVFNGMKNPMYSYPIKYFEYNDYLVEVAITPQGPTTIYSRPELGLPLLVGAMLFVDNKYAAVTVLEKDTLEKTDLNFRTRFSRSCSPDDLEPTYYFPFLEEELKTYLI